MPKVEDIYIYIYIYIYIILYYDVAVLQVKSTWCLLLGFWPLLGSVADYFLTVIRQADLTDWVLDSFGIRVLQNNCGRPYSILHACLNVHSPLLLDHACVWKNTTPTWLYSMKISPLKWAAVLESHRRRGAGRVVSECGVDCHGRRVLFKARALACNSLLFSVMPVASLFCLCVWDPVTWW